MKKILSFTLAVSMLMFSACAEEQEVKAVTTAINAYAAFEAEYTDRDLDASYDEASAKVMNLFGGSQINISNEGIYVLTGIMDGGAVVIDAPETDKIQLVLRDVEIASSDGPAIYAKQCDKLFITLEGTNYISDSVAYTLPEGEDEPDAAIFVKNDVTFNGNGSLNVTGNYKHGIASKDDVKITGGAINITSVEDGIKGRDSVLIKNGTLNITAGTDGIQSNNDSGEDKGRISVDGGTVNIVAGNDGIQAESILQVNGGMIDIKSGDEANTEIKVDAGMGGGMPGGRGGGRGMRPGPMGEMPDGTMPPMPDGTMPPRVEGEMGGGRGMRPGPMGEMPDGTIPPMTENGIPGEMQTNVETEENTESKKGLKSANALYIKGGEITISAEDDAIHSDLGVQIDGGTLSLRTTDDAVHGEYECVVNGGNITISRCYEGLEGKTVIINSGTLDINAADDAINASDPESTGSMPGRGNDEVYIEINGGIIKAVSGFDTLDANGNIFINGGDITIDGPSNGMDCAIDCDGKAYVNGGTVAVSGISSGSPAFDAESEQASVAVIFTSRLEADTTAAIYDSNGNMIASIKPTKAYGGVIFSSEKLKKGKKYTVKAGDKEVSVELSEMNVVVSDTGEAVSMGTGRWMPGGRGGMR